MRGRFGPGQPHPKVFPLSSGLLPCDGDTYIARVPSLCQMQSQGLFVDVGPFHFPETPWTSHTIISQVRKLRHKRKKQVARFTE